MDLKAANKASPGVSKNTDVKDYAANVAAPAKKSVHKPDAAAVPVEVDSATAGIEKKKKKKKPKPTYNLAGALSKGETIPGVTDKPKPAGLPKQPKAAPAAARPVQAKIGEKATSMPKPEEIETLPDDRPTQKAKKLATEKSSSLQPKKEKTYHPDAQRSTQEIQDERKKQEIAQRIQQRRQGLGGQAMDQVGNLGQGALGTVDQLGQNLPVGSKAVSGATRGVGNTLGAATKGLGGTLDDTTGALGRGDIGGTLGGATKGLGDTVGGVGKGLVCYCPGRSCLLLHVLISFQGDTLGGTVGGLGDGLPGPVGGIVGGAGRGLGNAVGGITGGLGSGVGKIGKGVSSSQIFSVAQRTAFSSRAGNHTCKS